MGIETLGEFGLIKRITKKIKMDRSVITGPGDDCAVVRLDKNNYQLLTCDMMTEGVDFGSREKPYLIGRKALAISISDIAACAGEPKYALVSMGVPRNAKIGTIDEITRGILDMANEFNVSLVGGDISRSQKLTIDSSLIGVVEKKNLVLRSGAKAGDYIFVTGELGGSIKGKHLKFMPRIKEARWLVKNFKINSMIDISDGLAQDLSHILEQSKVGAVIYEDMVPQSKDSAGLSDALYSGEDFELLFTLNKREAIKLLKKDPAFKTIGYITDKRNQLTLVDRHARERRVFARGYRHF